MKEALLVTRRLGCGGVERSVLTLVDHLAHAGWRFRLAPLEAGGDLADSARHPERVLRPPVPGVWAPRHLRYVDRINALVRRRRPRALLTFCLDSLIAAAFVPRRGVLWVAYVGSDVRDHLEREYRPFHRILGGLLGLAYRRPDHVVAVSQGLRQALIGNFGLGPDRVSCIPNPVDLERVSAGAAQTLAEGDFLLAAGRLIPMKGFDLLVRALAGTNHRLLILGRGPQHAGLEQLARKVGARVELVGYRANPWAYMRQARLVVVPSRGEGFSNVMVEAMACGAALVVSDCPHGPREIVRAGEARLVPSEDVGALARAIRDLSADEQACARLRQAARERARDFAPERICPEYVRLLEART